MRALLFVHSLRRGGAERVLLELAVRLMSKGHGVEVVSWLGVDEYPEERYAAVPRQFLMSKDEYRWPWSVPSAAQRLKAIVATFRPDVIELHTPTVAWVAAWAGIQLPVVHVLQGYGALTRGQSLKDRAMRFGDRLSQHKLHSRFIVPARAMAEAGAAHFRAAPARFICVPNGVDLESFAVKSKRAPGGPRIMMMGTLSRHKGQQWGVKAFLPVLKMLPDAKLTIVGEGPFRQELERIISESGLEGRVELPGRVKEAFKLMSESDLFWHLSESEGLPMVVLEAMASGLPVIGFDVRGTRDAVTNGETGYLVPIGDISAVAEKSVLLVTRSEEYERMSIAARKRVISHFTLETMTTGHEKVMLSAIEADVVSNGGVNAR